MLAGRLVAAVAIALAFRPVFADQVRPGGWRDRERVQPPCAGRPGFAAMHRQVAPAVQPGAAKLLKRRPCAHASTIIQTRTARQNAVMASPASNSCSVSMSGDLAGFAGAMKIRGLGAIALDLGAGEKGEEVLLRDALVDAVQ